MLFSTPDEFWQAAIMAFRRLHKSSIVVGVVSALILALVNIPGRVVEWQPHSFTTFEHGWPYAYLRRQTIEPRPRYFDPVVYGFRRDAIRDLSQWGIPSLSIDNWKIWEARVDQGTALWHFSAPMFAIDLVASGALLAAIVGAWKIRKRRRNGFLQFSLGETFIAVAALSVALGWLVYTQREYRRDKPLAERAWIDTEVGFGIVDETCVAPDWIRALVGDRLMPDFTWRVSSAQVFWHDMHDANKVCKELAEFSRLRTIVIEQYWEEDSQFPFSALRSLNHLERIEIDNNYYPFDEQDVRELTKLQGLKEIAFWNLEAVPPELLSQLQAALPGCRIVDMYDIW